MFLLHQRIYYAAENQEERRKTKNCLMLGVRTTMIYTHVMEKSASRVPSPLDGLVG